MNDLPEECIVRFLLKLRIDQICKFCKISSAAKSVCESELLWRLLVRRDFGDKTLKNTNSWKTLYQLLNTYLYTATITTLSSVTPNDQHDPYNPRGINTQVYLTFDQAFDWILEDIRSIGFDVLVHPSLIPGFNTLSQDFQLLVSNEPYYTIQYETELDHAQQRELELYTQMLITFIKSILKSGTILTTAGTPLIYYSIIKTRIHV